MLHGREREEQEIGRLLSEAGAGRGAALAVVAEAGGGKSALLRRAAESAALQESAAEGAGFQVLRCTGIESESELPFAALQLLLTPALGRLDALPVPQADALRAALGLAPPGGADRFLVGVAALSLLAELSAEGPVLCLVDDAQWLDQPSADALLFAARRLAAESIALLFAGREEFSAPGLPELRPARLDRSAARSLLAEHAPELPSHVRDRVLAEAGGNPLALLELPRTDVDLLSVGPLPLPHRLQETYQRRIAELSGDTRTALLVAAAEESGELSTVLRVLGAFSLAADALAEAESAGLVDVTDRSIAFRHPLMRAAAYQGAPFTRRLAVHAAITDALTDDPDRAAWHRAAATTGPDEEAAAGLAAAAVRAGERTGYATAAAAWERSARLTPPGPLQVRRLVSAAETAADAGQSDRALQLSGEAGRLTDDPLELARLAGVRARVECEHGSLRSAFEVLVPAADAVAPLAPGLAAEMLVEAARTAWTTGDPGRVEHAHRRLLALPLDPSRAAMIQSVAGALDLVSGDAGAGVALLRKHVASAREVRAGMLSLRLTLALQAQLIGEFTAAQDMLLALADECRTLGMVGRLPAVLSALALAEAHLGRFRDAAAAADECRRIAGDTGQPGRIAQAEAMLAFLAAVGGDEETCRTLGERSLRTFAAESNAVAASRGEWALALLDLGLGRHEAALDRMEAASRGPVRFGGYDVAFAADRVEAAVRLGRPERAAEPLARIAWWADVAPGPWPEAMLLRCKALLGGHGEAYAQALRLHAEDGGRPFDRARTGLLHGEWLRRQRRKTEARTQLRDVLETFERLGAVPWADHARAELRAAGEGSVQATETDLAALLTPQELQVVRLAATGATNKEIGSQLFLSSKTVGHHLYRAFPKLRVSTRTELARLDLG
ncbi:LuxR C-terminal-related transcriptional regulator [Streptomyces sp. NPDC057136]|uniref:helix-turn-helix transcriptional regulator n=1 Tax=Streptomyces sp. NPDC057136 TaxID=3346029 RepID=UPI0036352657